MPAHHDHAALIWQIADLLRGPYTPPQYERVMLPMTVLRRFDCVLAPTKAKVLAEHQKRKGGKFTDDGLDKVLNKAAGQRFHNHSPLTFEKLKGDSNNIEKHLVSYIKGFSANVRQIFDYFSFETEIEKMHEAGILYLVVSKFCEVDLHPTEVPSEQMGLIFENLIRRFYELANETAGDHFTPREVIRLMVHLLFIEDDALLSTPGTVRKLLDPACGTGGMLAEAQNYLREHHAAARLYTYGQDDNKRAFATAASEMLIKEVAHNGMGDNVRYGDIFTDDRFKHDTFDYFLANPPFGVDWKKQKKEITREHEKEGFQGRFGAGLPRVNDGSLLFLQHMLAKFEPVRPDKQQHGSRLATVFSGSPLFTGGAGSGESEIRKWIIEKDMLEAVIALPEQMFYNTGIGTYVWILTNRKEKRRRGKIQLLDARDCWQAGGSETSKRSLGDKRRHITATQIDGLVKLYHRFKGGETAKVFDNSDFGYTRVTVERPLRLRFVSDEKRVARFVELIDWDEAADLAAALDHELTDELRRDWNQVAATAEALMKNRREWRFGSKALKSLREAFGERDPAAAAIIADEWVAEIDVDFNFDRERNGGTFFNDDEKADWQFRRYEPDSQLRDFENIPLKQDIDAYFRREVMPHVQDAWMDRGKDKIGYEINFNRHFYHYSPPRELESIDADLKAAEEEFMRLFKEVTA